MKILAFMQCLWFRDSTKAAEIFARHPEKRNDLIRLYLFAGCLTGRRLQQALGEKICHEIVWEEASPRIGDHASSKFEADLNHIRQSIETHQPEIIVCFGKVAGDAVRGLDLATRVLYAPHPASRENPMPALRSIAFILEEAIRR
jgi:hypothetical protein